MIELRERVERVLDRTFLGLHHVPCRVYWRHEGTPLEYAELHPPRTLSTFDFDDLTRLVVAAHDECVRLEIGPSGPGRVRLRMSLRHRTGGIWDRHPTMEDALAKIREKYPIKPARAGEDTP